MKRLSRIAALAASLSLLTQSPGNSVLLFAAEWPFQDSTSVERLSRQVDRLEKHLDEYGTVVTKAPDVWGQARLTKYRVEYEAILEAEKEGFTPTINASISRSDQAFLASAMALQAAISGQQASMTVPVVRELTTNTETIARNPDGTIIFDKDGNPLRLVTSKPELVPGSDQKPIEIPGAASGTGLIGNPDFTHNQSVTEKSVMGFGAGGVALEPTLKLDQMSRYLNHLHELRRISDGDDKADAPGYALHLVRLPVSVLPGKRTREGYGAEVTFIAKPHLHERLLPTTFRGLVINDAVEHTAFPLATFIDGDDPAKTLSELKLALLLSKDPVTVEKIRSEAAQFKTAVSSLNSDRTNSGLIDKVIRLFRSIVADAKQLNLLDKDATEKFERLIADLESEQSNYNESIVNLSPKLKQYVANQLNAANLDTASIPESEGLNNAQLNELEAVHQSAGSAIRNFSQSASEGADRVAKDISPLLAAADQLSLLLSNGLQRAQVSIPSMASARNRRSLLPYPSTQALEVMGAELLIDLAELALPLKQTRFHENATLILELQTFLSEEFHAAYEFLNHNDHLWNSCTAELAHAVRAKDKVSLEHYRRSFLDQIVVSKEMTFTKALAWSIIVESALLNDSLVEDMKELSASKNAYCLNTNWLPYFGPNPPPEAVQAFNDYVNCRWPIHVVAVDPVTQDQNVADRFSQRREMQLALSLAFASGRIGAQNFTRLNQRIELDMETIALNRTAVGFSHGNDTFGWRFMPRVQSPDTESPVKAVGRMLFTGGPTRNHLANESRLEPGIRECTAVVIMPSFVPYVIFDQRTNWFRLTNPAKKELDLRDGVGLSAEITSLRSLSQLCVQDQHLYRQDEVYRLQRAVDQLEERLPLQTTYLQMPYENSLGGFEFFNSGVSDLAPELHGFYGEPGIQLGAAEETTVFLVGDHFSNHETRIVIGNKPVAGDKMRLLSRQVIQVTIPGTVHVEANAVDAHVATPYGVSNHILIPVHKQPATTASAADAAIAAHVALKHIDKFTYAATDVPIRICLNENRKPTQVILQGSVVVSNGTDTPFVVETADFAAFLIPKLKGKDPDKTAKLSIQLSGQKFANGKMTLSETGLQDEVLKKMKDRYLPSDLEEFHVQGFLKVVDAGAPQVVRLENTLRLKVEICELPCCQPKAVD